jgi:exodeoxyribonuclease VII large subunit
MRRAGLGALCEAFEKLKARLGAEGLFAPEHKRALPQFPRRVGVVTSLQAAALRDVLTTLRRRLPGLPVIIYPTPVQGDGAADRIALTLTLASARGECDVLIVCRGGGSIEDLWAYNEEVVARAIRACAVPVITGIGHETDFTIADFAADVRAPTPTAAAELAVPDCVELRQHVQHQQESLSRALKRFLEDHMQRLDYLSRRVLHPGDYIRNRIGHLHHLASRLRGGWQRQDQSRTWHARELARRHARARPDPGARARRAAELARRLRKAAQERLQSSARYLQAIEAHLKHLNPELVLERGYSITETDASRIVRDSATLAVGAGLRIRFAKGSVEAQVTGKSDRKKA